MPRIESSICDPHLSYRLDPGEPGLLRQAKASQSMMAVSAQERRNLQRLKFEAVMRGERVIFADIRYAYGRDGSFSSIRAGKTTVVSRKQESDPLTQVEKLMSIPEEEPQKAEKEEGLSNESEVEEIPQVDQRERLGLLTYQRRLREKLKELKTQETRETDPRKVKEIKREKRQIEEYLRLLESELRKQAEKDISSKLDQLQGTMAFALKSQTDASSDLLALKYSTRDNGQNSELTLFTNLIDVRI